MTDTIGRNVKPDKGTRANFFDLIELELERAYAKHGSVPWSRHEFYAILLEEVEEAWDEIKHDRPDRDLVKEIMQVAAMCVRYVETRPGLEAVVGELYDDMLDARRTLQEAANG